MQIRNVSIARIRGFTLIELMITIGIVAILAAIGLPSYQGYVVRSKVTEGLVMMSEPKQQIGSFYGTTGRLPANFTELGFSAASGSAFGGDAGSFESVFGFDSEVWRRVEWQPKSGGWVLVLRSKRRPAWGNVDIGLHMQVKAEDNNVKFRCTVNNNPQRRDWVPSQCHMGGVNDWSW